MIYILIGLVLIFVSYKMAWRTTGNWYELLAFTGMLFLLSGIWIVLAE